MNVGTLEDWKGYSKAYIVMMHCIPCSKDFLILFFESQKLSSYLSVSLIAVNSEHLSPCIPNFGDHITSDGKRGEINVRTQY